MPENTQPSPAEVEAAVYAIADRSRQAARSMGRANRALKDQGLRAIGAALLERKARFLPPTPRTLKRAARTEPRRPSWTG